LRLNERGAALIRVDFHFADRFVRPHTSPMRLFIGIPLSAQAVDELSRLVGRLRAKGDGLRWTAPASWHITLQFLGETGREQCEDLIAQLRTLHPPPFPVALEKPGCFERSGVFFVAVRPSAELAALQRSVLARTARCGFVAESRSFQPHITLARSREPRSGLGSLMSRLPGDVRTEFTATEFLLYESFLGPGGARYEVRGRFPAGRISAEAAPGMCIS
jgi:2'-5' RNA ligase